MKENPGKIDLYRVDTHYPDSANRSLAVVLYGELGTKSFAQFHKQLKQYAEDGMIDYVIRHYVRVSSVIGILKTNSIHPNILKVNIIDKNYL